jgi:hypothetical protein
MVEAVPGLLVNEAKKGLEMLVSDEAFGRRGNHAGGVKFQYLPGDLLRGKNGIHLSRAEGRERHGGELGCRRVLNEDGPTRCSYSVHAAGPVGSRAGKDDGDGPLNGIFGQGDEELIDGEMYMLMGLGGNAKGILFDPYFLRRGAKVESVGKDLEAVGYFLDDERSFSGRKQIGQEALV